MAAAVTNHGFVFHGCLSQQMARDPTARVREKTPLSGMLLKNVNKEVDSQGERHVLWVRK